MLEFIREYFKLSDEAMHGEIQNLHVETQRILADKDIPYEQLKSALIPSIDRNEAGFIFDSQKFESSWYGYEVAQIVLPLFHKRSTQSVRWGDLLGPNQTLIYSILEEFMVLAQSFKFVHGTQLYCVYINNLSNSSLNHLHRNLSSFPAYLGYIPATFQTRAKTYLSTTLVNGFVKYRDVVVMGHEDDRPNVENINIIGYPYEDFGYRVRSLQSRYFDLFLSFKIERAVYPGFEVDTEMSLNAVSLQIVSLSDCTVQLDEAKHGYLKDEKFGKLKNAGIAELDRNELAQLIKAKIGASYIYNMAFLEAHNVVKFNLIVEVPHPAGGYPTRLLVALEYQPSEKILRVITLH